MATASKTARAKLPVQPVESTFGAYLRYLADHMGLRDWTFVISNEPAQAGRNAEITPVWGRKHAVLRLGAEWPKLAPEAQRAALVHELVECHMAPARFVAMDTMPRKTLRTFEDKSDEMVVLKGITFHSLCEHHVLGFNGTVAVGYLPGDKVVGISKLARLVECYARRLQIQERMTHQIASDIEKYLGALGVGVVVKAHHSCMGCRGVQQPQAEMVTSAMLGRLRTCPIARAEFLQLIS